MNELQCRRYDQHREHTLSLNRDINEEGKLLNTITQEVTEWRLDLATKIRKATDGMQRGPYWKPEVAKSSGSRPFFQGVSHEPLGMLLSDCDLFF